MGFYPEELLQKYIDENKSLDDIMFLSMNYGIQQGFDYLIKQGKIFDKKTLSKIFISTNNVEELKKMDSKYYDRSSFALYGACCSKVEKIDIVKFIVENTIKYNYDIEIKTAASSGFYNTTKYLLENTYDINELYLDDEDFESLIELNRINIINLLLDYVKNIDNDPIIYDVLCNDKYEILNIFINHNYIFSNFEYYSPTIIDLSEKTLKLIYEHSTDEFKESLINKLKRYNKTF